MFEEDETQEDTSFQDFTETAKEIFALAPDVTSGLGALQDTYSEFEFQDKKAAAAELEKYSSELRKKFFDSDAPENALAKNIYNKEVTINAAPIDFEDITPEGKNEDEKQLDWINKWEQENLKVLSETEEPAYIQDREFLSTNIRKAASEKRREILGSENSYITDIAFRAAQAAVSPLTDTLGLEGVESWLKERTDPDGQTILGMEVGGDNSWTGAFASAGGFVGGLVGATAAGALVGGPAGAAVGSGAFLGGSAIGSVRSTMEESAEAGAPLETQLQAGAIEAGSQAVQLAAGAKFLAGPITKMFGKAGAEAAEEVSKPLGARLTKGLATSFAGEGAAEGVGQVISNQAENVGTGTDGDLSRGVLQSIVVGGVTGSAVQGIGNVVDAVRQPEVPVAGETTTVPPEVKVAQEFKELETALQEIEGAPLPPKEVLMREPVTITPEVEPEVVAKDLSGVEYVKVNDTYHVRTKQGVSEPYEAQFYVTPEVAKQLYDAQNASTSDGQANVVTVSNDGKLVIRNEGVTKDEKGNLIFTPGKSGVEELEIPASRVYTPGAHAVFANSVKVTAGIKEAPAAYIGTAPLDVKEGTSTAGAANIDFFGNKELGYINSLRKRIGDDMAAKLGLAFQFDVDNADGTTSTVTLPKFKYDKQKGEYFTGMLPKAAAVINEKGFLKAYSDIMEADRYNDLDVAVGRVMQLKLQELALDAEMSGDLETAAEVNPLYLDITTKIADLVNNSGKTSNQVSGAAEKVYSLYNADANEIKAALVGRANQRVREYISSEFDVAAVEEKIRKDNPEAPVTPAQILTVLEEEAANEVSQATQEYEAVKQEIDSPILEQAAEIDAKIAEIDSKYDKQIDTEVATVNSTIEQLEARIEEEGENFTVAEQQLNEEILATAKELEDAQTEIEKVQSETLTETKGLLKDEQAAAKAIDKIKEKKAEIAAELSKIRDSKDDLPSEKQRLKQELDIKAKKAAELTPIEAKKEDSKERKAEVKLYNEKAAKAQRELKEATKAYDKIVEKEAELLAKNADLDTKLEKANERMTTVQAAKVARTSTARKPKTEQLKKIDAIQKRLAKQKESLAKLNPTKAALAEETSKTINQLKQRAAELLKQKQNKPVTPAKTKLLQKRNELLAQHQASPFATKEGHEKLKQAKQNVENAKQKADKVKKAKGTLAQYIKEEGAKFTPQDQKDLQSLSRIIDSDSSTPEAKQAAVKKVADIKNKNGINNTTKTDKVYAYWRDNVLSGLTTTVQNIWSTFTVMPSTVVSRLAVDAYSNVRNLEFNWNTSSYIKGMLEAAAYAKDKSGKRKLGVGLARAAEVIKGNVKGKYANDSSVYNEIDTTVRPVLSHYFKDDGFTLKPLFKNPIDPILGAVEIMRRVMAASDVYFNSVYAHGEARYAARYVARQNAKSDAEVLSNMENLLYSSDAQHKSISAKIEQEARDLEVAGIKMSPAQKRMAYYSAMEAAMDARIRTVSERHANKSTFMGEPDGALGLMSKLIIQASSKAKFNVGGKEVYPLRFVMPFTRTIANVGNQFLQHTPIGLWGYSKTKGRGAELELEGEYDTYQFEAREQFAQAMLGSTAMAGLVGLALSFADDEDPYIAFYSYPRRGEAKRWEELGIPRVSIKLGNTYIPLLNTPLAPAAVVAAEVASAYKNGLDYGQVAVNATMAMVSTLAQVSFVKNVTELFDAVTGARGSDDPNSSYWESLGEVGSRMAANTIQGFIPGSGLLKSIYRMSEASPVDTYNSLAAKLTKEMPVVGNYFGKPALNSFGEPIEKPLWNRSPGNVIAGAANPDPVFMWMQQSGFKVTYPGPTFKLTDDMQRVYGEQQKARYGHRAMLTPEQSREVLQDYGPKLKEALAKLAKDPEWRTATPEKQAKINAFVTKLRAESRLKILRKEYPIRRE